jgi:hypothetical protein
MDRAEVAQRLGCSARRTMLTRPMPSAAQIRTSIRPRLEAAAVWTRALWPSTRTVSIIDSAVSGLTNSAAPSAVLRSSGSSTTAAASATR